MNIRIMHGRAEEPRRHGTRLGRVSAIVDETTRSPRLGLLLCLLALWVLKKALRPKPRIVRLDPEQTIYDDEQEAA